MEGVGIIIRTDRYKYYGEWHLNKPHGCIKGEWADGNTRWGELFEGYGTGETADGDRYIG